MKQQFNIAVPIIQFKAIKALLSSTELSNYDIYNNWSTEMSERDNIVTFTYVGGQKDIPHSELKETFATQWSELLQIAKERFADAFNCEVKEHDAEYYIKLLYGTASHFNCGTFEAKQVKRTIQEIED